MWVLLSICCCASSVGHCAECLQHGQQTMKALCQRDRDILRLQKDYMSVVCTRKSPAQTCGVPHQCALRNSETVMFF